MPGILNKNISTCFNIALKHVLKGLGQPDSSSSSFKINIHVFLLLSHALPVKSGTDTEFDLFATDHTLNGVTELDTAAS